MKVKISDFSLKIYEQLLIKSIGRDTPLEKLEDYLERAFDKFDITKDDKVKVLSQTLSNAVISITTEAMRNSIILAEKDAKYPHEVELIEAQIGELGASARLKDAQKGKIDKEKDTEDKKLDLYAAQAAEARARADLLGKQGVLYDKQAKYYLVQANVEKAKISADVASMAFTNDVVVGKEVWEKVRGYIDNITTTVLSSK